MCRELNALGLPDPVFDNNTFILKTTIRSAAYEKLPVGEKEVGHSTKNVAIEYQKVTDSAKNVAIEKIPLLEILRLCDIKNYNQVTPSALMGWTDDPILNIAEKDLITDFRKLNPAGQTAAAAAVKGFTQMQQYKNDDSAPAVKEEAAESSA